MMSPRKCCSQSRVPWMFTGRCTMSISCCRSGVSSGAMSGSVVAQRFRMDAGNPERAVVAEHVGADERQVEVARARSICVERRAVDEARAGDGAAAQNGCMRLRHRRPDDVAEAIVLRSVVVERELQHAGQLFGIRRMRRHGLCAAFAGAASAGKPASRSLRAIRSSIQCESHHSVAFTNWPFTIMLKCR